MRPVILGIVLMTCSMLFIPLVDGMAKILGQSFSPLYVSWARYVSGALIALPLTLALCGRQVWPTQGIGSQVARTVFIVAAMTLYFGAVASVPLADATAAYLLAPIIAAVLAVLVLGEAMSRRKVIAVILGLAGALTIVRPGFNTEPGILLAVGAGVMYACYVIATRKASQSANPLVTLNFQYVFGALLLAPLGFLYFSMPTTQALMLIGLMGVISIICHLLSILAFRYAQASTLAPLIYIEMIGSVTVGYWFFGDFPTTLTWVGIAIIIASGLLLLQHSNRGSS